MLCCLADLFDLALLIDKPLPTYELSFHNNRERVFASPSHLLANPSISTMVSKAEEVSNNTSCPDELNFPAAFPLTDLPNELINYVFNFLDSVPPSEVRFNELPSADYTDAKSTPLKDLSKVSQRLRGIVLPRLFANARLDPYKLTAFLRFLYQRELSKYVHTIVAKLQGPCNHLHPAWWARLLNEVPAHTFTIICAPHVFAELVGTSIVGTDAWAFNMPYQLLKLKQEPESVYDQTSLTNLPSLFSARKWTDVSVNEGSSLKAYTTYEYFFRDTPSLLGTIHASKLTIADGMLAELQSFTFIAIFPFFNHVDEILKTVRKMRRLKILRTKLCPEPQSTVFNDEIASAGGHIDVNDPWNEFDTAYTLVAQTVHILATEGQLQEFHVDDVKMTGIRETLENSLKPHLEELWLYRGDGIWIRQMRQVLNSPPLI